MIHLIGYIFFLDYAFDFIVVNIYLQKLKWMMYVGVGDDIGDDRKRMWEYSNKLYYNMVGHSIRTWTQHRNPDIYTKGPRFYTYILHIELWHKLPNL